VTLVYDIAMRVRFRGQTRRQGVLLQGPAGWGEFSPFPDYDDATCARWLAAAREAAYDGWPAPVRDRVPVNTTVPAVGPEQAHAMVRASGCTTAKVKVAEVGQTLADDVARVEAVRDALGPAGKVRVDANAAWSVDEAVVALRALDAFDLEYAEQPVATLDDMALLRRRIDVPLAADESVRRAEDPLRIAGLGAADIVVLKVQPIGGVRRCLEVAARSGLPVVVSSAVETSVGIAAGVALAAALPELPYACGLGTVSLLAADVTAEPLLPVGGFLPVRRVAPDPDLVNAADEVKTHWLARMQAAADAA
jgi:O-succinylbenzoate synthase